MLFLWYYRKPFAFGVTLQETMSRLVPYAILMHLAFGTWMLSGVSAFVTSTDSLTTSSYSASISALASKSAVYTAGVSRLSRTASVPLIVLFAVIAVVMLVRFALGFVGSVLIGVFHFMTCHSCPHACDMCKKRSRSGDWVVDQLSYSDAVRAAHALEPGAMQGTLGYNILLNEEIQTACAISPDFAKTHHSLNDVANDRAAYGRCALGRRGARTRSREAGRD